MGQKKLPLAWAGVTVLGLVVVILVVSWQLFPRLTAAQSLIDDLNPAFTRRSGQRRPRRHRNGLRRNQRRRRDDASPTARRLRCPS